MKKVASYFASARCYSVRLRCSVSRGGVVAAAVYLLTVLNIAATTAAGVPGEDAKSGLVSARPALLASE